ncbi:MAG: hypothetical protein ACR2O8_08530 [Rhizobiaceae bacterium]
MTKGLQSRQNSTVIKRRWIKPRDFFVLIALVPGTILACLLPRRMLIPTCGLLSRFLPVGLFDFSSPKQIARALEITVKQARGIMRNSITARLTALLAFLRAKFRAPPFDITIEGTEHIDAALAQGHGVVLWLADLVYTNYVQYIALRENGYTPSHLSRPEHGFSDTKFGLTFLNPIRQNFELKYLRERIVYRRESPNEAGALIRQRLSGNGVVSIYASGYEGRKFVELDFLSGRLKVAAGAPGIAYKQGCPILPVFAVPNPDPLDFKVTIGKPLKLDNEDKDKAISEATEDFFGRLAPMVKQRPELFRAWSAMSTN